jgi:hypothetical protein
MSRRDKRRAWQPDASRIWVTTPQGLPKLGANLSRHTPSPSPSPSPTTDVSVGLGLDGRLQLFFAPAATQASIACWAALDELGPLGGMLPPNHESTEPPVTSAELVPLICLAVTRLW